MAHIPMENSSDTCAYWHQPASSHFAIPTILLTFRFGNFDWLQ
jgi:hypothetical protein